MIYALREDAWQPCQRSYCRYFYYYCSYTFVEFISSYFIFFSFVHSKRLYWKLLDFVSLESFYVKRHVFLIGFLFRSFSLEISSWLFRFTNNTSSKFFVNQLPKIIFLTKGNQINMLFEHR